MTEGVGGNHQFGQGSCNMLIQPKTVVNATVKQLVQRGAFLSVAASCLDAQQPREFRTKRYVFTSSFYCDLGSLFLTHVEKLYSQAMTN